MPKTKGGVMALPVYLAVVLCFFSCLLSASPVNRHDSSTIDSRSDQSFPAGLPHATSVSYPIAETSPADKTELVDRAGGSNNYALNCGFDRTETTNCQRSGYYCNSYGQLKGTFTYGVTVTYCEAFCNCVSLISKPIPCVYLGGSNPGGSCLEVDGVAYDSVTKEIIGNVSKAKTLADGTLDFTAPIEKCETDGKVRGLVTDEQSSVDYNKDVTLDPTDAKLPVVTVPTKTTVTPTFTKVLHSRTTETPDLSIDFLGCWSYSGTLSPQWSFDWPLTNQCRIDGYYCIVELNPTLTYTFARSSAAVELCEVSCACATSVPPPTLARDAHDHNVRLPAARSDAETMKQTNADDGKLDMQCSTDGNYDQTLTGRCTSESYTCLRTVSSPLSMLHHTGAPDQECADNCKCPNSFMVDIADGTTSDDSSSTSAEPTSI